jgi:hypothetical protein
LEEALGMIEKREAYKHFVEHLTFVNSNPNIRLLLLSQGTEDIHQELIKSFDFPTSICITDYTQADIDKFVEVEVAELIKQKPQLFVKEQEIVRKLQSGSQGMFQWVSASIGHLNDVQVPEDVDKCLDDLPQGVASTYSRMFQRIKGKADYLQLRVKVALRWLAVSARPLTSLELKVAIMLGDNPEKPENLEKVAKFISEDKYNYTEYAQELRTLLEDLVQIDQFGEVPTLQLSHPSLRMTLTSEPNLFDDGPIGPYKFSFEKAHEECALACIQLIRHSTFSHTNAFGIAEAPLVEYAWEFWAYHFKLNDERLKKMFDKMILETTRDAITFLDALTDFVSSPLEHVPGVDGDLTYIVSLQHAQESILPSMKALDVVRSKAPLSPELVKAREITSRAAYSATPITKAHEVGSWVQRRATKFRINYLRTQSAVTTLRTDDYLAKNVQLKSSIYPSMNALWDAARKLRIVALRFAVNPVYGALIAKAGGLTFSPIHFLVYTAGLLEECGNYPYWDDLPPTFDIMEPFICGPLDPFAGAARFVLHSFEYRYPVTQEADPVSEIAREPSPKPSLRHRRARSHSPRPDPRDVGAYQTISADDRRKAQALQEMPGDKYITAQHAYHLFHTKDNDWLGLIVNPLKNIHMDRVLHLKEERLVQLNDPRDRLARHAPQSIQTSPLTNYLRALPMMLRLSFTRYFAYIVEFFGSFTRYALAQHYARFETAKEELKGMKEHYYRLLNPDDPVRLWHLAPALVIFWLRSRYIPKFGAHFSPHPWREFLFSYKHPAAYLDWQQNAMTFWAWCLWILNYVVARTLTVSTLTAGLTLPPGISRDALNITGAFFLIVQLERSVFSICFIFATLVATARVLFMDHDTTVAVASFSFWYWINTFVGICISCIHLGTVTQVTEWWHIMIWLFSQFMLTMLWVIYQRVIWRFLTRFFMASLYHLTWPIWLVVKAAMEAYVPLLKFIGITAFVYAGFLAMYWMSRWMRDPYDTQSSYSDLEGARRIARHTIKQEERKRIGQYPLGEATEEDSGFRLSVRAPTLEYKSRKADADANQQQPFTDMTEEGILNLVLGAESVPRGARERSTSPSKKLVSSVWDDDVSSDQLWSKVRIRSRSADASVGAEKKKQ